MVRIGSAGWGIPRQSSAYFVHGESHLQRYSREFNCCEINSSFYRPHKNETWQRWAGTVPAEFRFSVKAPRTITHEAKLKSCSGLLPVFLEQIKFLGAKLGPLLFQLPPSLEFDAAVTKSFLSLLRQSYSGDAVFEPRHRSWFTEPIDDLLKEYYVARVAADPACVPAAAEPGGASKLAYFRLHGSPRLYYSAYSEEFLDGLATRLEILAATVQVWCIFDNTASGFAIQNALYLNHKSKQLGNLTVTQMRSEDSSQ